MILGAGLLSYRHSRDFRQSLTQCFCHALAIGGGELNRSCVMSFFKMIAKPAAVALTVVSMACTVATAQAQSGKRIVVAMAPADVSPGQEAKPMRASAPAMTAPRAKRVAAVAVSAAKTDDCFWCNRVVYISGLNF